MIPGVLHNKIAYLALASILFATVGVSLVHSCSHRGEGRSLHRTCSCHSLLHQVVQDDHDDIQIGAYSLRCNDCPLCQFLSTFQFDSPCFQVDASFESLCVPCALPGALFPGKRFSPSVSPRGPPACYRPQVSSSWVHEHYRPRASMA